MTLCLAAAATAAKVLQSCPTLCDPIVGSPPGSSAHGILQARVLEWGAIAFSESISKKLILLINEFRKAEGYKLNNKYHIFILVMNDRKF